ncbi:FAD-dependent oxidoreductase [Novosphingobium album (ex Liu et al. 2023)]|uniref:FAD-dependent monooxygenase n=1 Tax=Novosphingobium album (ex Liu et al. 2023) TaxID=3031130 RepID=A0ABT5WP60_9SPHN|nr:FAD-dependent monooxygenase [Novosphingobium album (ex Liu et al. 2023)]MDE8651536.1 FAD-dependent monooxygenase [Novosphingobium album (ex Liu et al. 2023)]
MLENPQVLVAGAGPVGLFSALLLGARGVPVRVFDINPGLQRDPRAATTHPATLEVIDVDGLVEDMARVGLIAPIYQFWDRPSARLVAEFDHGLLGDETRFPFVIQCEQFKTSRLILDRLLRLGNVEVLFDHEVLLVTQTADAVAVEVKGPGGIASHRAAYLIGADGGRSTVRKQCDIAFEGFTWDERFIVLTTPFDFAAERGYCYRSYFADPEAWCNCFKVAADGPPGLWRTVFPTTGDTPLEELMSDAGAQALLQKYFPADRPYEIVHRNIYTTHQRVAHRFRQGRVALAGDAAHVNNPIGGMGLNGGLQDAANLADKLSEIVLNGAPDSLLDLYDLQRRTLATEFVQEQSIANKKRLEASDEETRQRTFAQLSETAADPARAKDFLLRSSMLVAQRRVNAMTL